MIVPVEDADDAEEAEDESSSTGSSEKPSVSSSPSTSMNGTGGGAGKPASFALAKDFCTSLMIRDSGRKGYYRRLIG
jgi:hypothetical protein